MSHQETTNLLTFQDVVACFSQQEWELLHKWQKDLYANLMKEINQVLMSLGPLIANSVFSLRTKEEEGFHPLADEDPDRSHSDDHSQSEKVTTAMISTGIKEEQEAHLVAEDLKSIVYFAGEEVPTAMISASIKEEEQAYCIAEQDFEDVKNISGHAHMADLTSLISLNIKEETEARFIDHPGSELKGRVSNLTDDPVITAFNAQSFGDDDEKLLRQELEDELGKGGDLSKKVSSSEKQPYAYTGYENDSTRMATLELYEIKQRGMKLFNCTECEKGFNFKGDLMRHLRIHTGLKPFRCTECERRFNQKAHLRCHMRLHTGFKPYSCSECEKSFTRNNALIQHQRIHTGVKPFSCSVCEKSFTRNNVLKRHLRVHTGVKPFH